MTHTIPPLGLGTYGRTGDAGTAAILDALEIGYRHLDTAQNYDTERQVGEAVRRSGLKRDEVFVTTKVGDQRMDKAQFMPSVERSLEQIGLGPVDLLLIHWPSKNDAIPFEDYMTSLAEARQRGFARLIGVSNFTIDHLERTDRLLGKGAIATNQVELHPYLQSPRLVAHALAQHQAHCALHVIALLDTRGFGLGADGPGRRGLQPGCPEDHTQVGPDSRVLVGEHHHLQAVAGHVMGEVLVDLHH